MNPGNIRPYANRIIVRIVPIKEARGMMTYIATTDHQWVTIPWLENRRLEIEFEAPRNLA